MASNSEETVSRALWVSLLAGLGAVAVVVLLGGFLYLFEPTAKKAIGERLSYVVIGIPLVFIGGFGMALTSALEFQFWRGKWK